MSFPFHRIGIDPGVTLHDSLENILVPAKIGSVVGYSLVNGENMKRISDDNLSGYFQRRRFSEGLEVKSFLATLSNPKFPRSWKSAQGKIVLNGASGNRAINFYRRQSGNIKKAQEVFEDEYKKTLADSSDIEIGSPKSHIFSIEIKNLFNFFHFLTESLHQFELVPSNVKVVNIITRGGEPKPFVKKWLQQLYPELVGKMKFLHPQNFSEDGDGLTLTPISGKHLLYQFSGKHIDLINDRAPQDANWLGYDPGRHHVKTLDINSYDSSLIQFHKRAIRLAAEGRYIFNLPYIYVARKPGLSRERNMQGEDKLVLILKDMGFVKVYLEEMEPLAQVALMNSAKCVVMQHGAGLANMIFGNPYTHFFEIGTTQTALRRWTDFIPLTHIGKCHYHSFFVDMDFPESAGMPVFARDGLAPPKLNDSSIQKILETIETYMNDDLPGSVAGLIHHAESISDMQAEAMLGKMLKKQAAKHV